MKILIAIDKFKGSLTSLEAAQAISMGIERAMAEAVESEPQGSATESVTGVMSSAEIMSSAGVAPARGGSANTYEIVEIADGGDGSANVLLSVREGVEVVKAEGVNPSGQKIESSYLSYYEPDSSDTHGGSAITPRKCAFIEMAKISGLELIPPVGPDGRALRNPLVTTTYGLGELIRKAYEDGARKITLSIGGSATNDGGTGMLQALGFKFYDKGGSLITDYMCGGLLSGIGKIEAPSDGVFGCACGIGASVDAGVYASLDASDDAKADVRSDVRGNARNNAADACEIEVICDVTNPLLGETGATFVYGPQKGADPSMLQQLEAGMENLVRVAEDAAATIVAGCERFGTMGAKSSGQLPHNQFFYEQPLQNQAFPDHLLPGTGAAGGVGYAVKHFLGGKIISGWRFFANITNLKQKISEADLVISGEGRIDSQSFNGKVVDGVITLAKEAGKPVWLFCGLNSLNTWDYRNTTNIQNPLSTGSNDTGNQSCTPELPNNIFQLADLEPDRNKSIANASLLLERLAYEVALSKLV